MLLGGCREAAVPVRDSYHLETWTEWPDSLPMGEPVGIDTDKEGNLWLFCRAGREWPFFGPIPPSPIPTNTVWQLDGKTGKLLRSWGAGLFIMPHGLTVDSKGHIWLTDVGLHQVFEFDQEGRLLLRLGQARVAGDDSLHFNLPTDVAVAGDGSFYVSDGYGNNRVAKFSPQGQFLFEWGRQGSGPGEFNLPHSIDIDAEGNLYVADRQNNRVQQFNPSGKFIREWKDGMAPVFSVKTCDEGLLAIDYRNDSPLPPEGSAIWGLNAQGVSLLNGRKASVEEMPCWFHDLAIAPDLTIYVADISGHRVLKFKKSVR